MFAHRFIFFFLICLIYGGQVVHVNYSLVATWYHRLILQIKVLNVVLTYIGSARFLLTSHKVNIDNIL